MGPPPGGLAQVRAARIRSETEDVTGGNSGAQLLVREDRQVLRDHVPEDGAEDAEVEASSVTGANNGSRINLGSQAHSRIPCIGSFAPSQIAWNTVRLTQHACSRPSRRNRSLHQRAIPCAVDGLGEIKLIAKAQISRQFGE